MTPQKNIHTIFIPPNVFHFPENHKINVKIHNFEPPKMVRASKAFMTFFIIFYLYMKISEYSPPPRLLDPRPIAYRGASHGPLLMTKKRCQDPPHPPCRIFLIRLWLMFLPLVCVGSVFGPCFFLMHYLVFFLVLQASWRGRKRCLFYFNCLLMFVTVSVLWPFLMRPWLVCIVNLWYLLIILTYFFMVGMQLGCNALW